MELRLINGYYFDEDTNNRWNARLYSLEGATKARNSLVGCTNCIDCHSCRYCRFCCSCNNCSSCFNCNDCAYCHLCNYCKYCNNCIECRANSGCSDCSYCHSCINCIDCRSCHYCSNFDRDPQRIVGPLMGSRNDTPTVYWLEVGKEQCVVGCFRGDLNELEKKVKYTHKDNPKHLNDYLQWIEKVRKYMED